MLLFYIRHGQPIYDPDSLTPLGERQAEAVARRLALFGVDKVFASTSNRAILTAKPTCDVLRLEPTLLDWCNESHAWDDTSVEGDGGEGRFWCWGLPSVLRKLQNPELIPLGMEWYRHPDFAKYPRLGPGIERVRDKADEFMASLGYEHDRAARIYRPVRDSDDRVALFAHEGFSPMFFSALLDIPYPMMASHFAIQHTGMTVVQFIRGARSGVVDESMDFIVPRVLQYSNDSHLYRGGLPLAYQDRLRF